MEKLHILFLCTSNSCLSQMAEGWARVLVGDSIKIKSAGIKIHGKNQRAINAMTEVGIDISKQQSICINREMLEWADLLVTLCDNAEEQCPVLDTHTMRLHLPLVDPEKIKGTEEELQAEFCEAREKVKERVEFIIEQLSIL